MRKAIHTGLFLFMLTLMCCTQHLLLAQSMSDIMKTRLAPKRVSYATQYMFYATQDQDLLVHFAEVQRELRITPSQKSLLQNALRVRAVQILHPNTYCPYEKHPKRDQEKRAQDEKNTIARSPSPAVA